MDWEVNYSYHWGGVEGEGVYTATGAEADQAKKGSELVKGRIKEEIAKKLYEESGVVLYEKGSDVPVNCGVGSLHKGASLGELLGHAALNIDGNFKLDVYEAINNARLIAD